MTDEGGIIIHLFGEPPAIEGAPDSKRLDYRCWPHSPIVDKQSRQVTCRRCERLLDPVDVLLQVADRHDDYVRIGKELSEMRNALVELRAEEKRIKQRMKSHSRKDAAVAVAAERERWNESLHKIVAYTEDIRSAARLIDKAIGKR